MPPSHEANLSSDVNTLVFRLLGELKEAVAALDKDFEGRVRSIEDARLYEKGYRKGVIWIVGIICSIGGSALTLFVKWKLGL